ncbi:hypothetical protein AB0A66_12940 [Streptomyces longwoodensis]|uniref:hypothetical protein n=1 Tax=Streptomyces longwoodensis TaxID=68231 RepID=UPI00340D385B
MPTIHREPRFTYDELLDLVEGQLRVVELTAINAEIGGPGERLWLTEPGAGADVYRLWRKDRGRGRGTYWAVDKDRSWEALVWLREGLTDVLERLTRPGSATRYALEEGREERDLAVLTELETIWLSGVSPLGEAYGPRGADVAVNHFLLIPAQAELARATAVRSRVLREHFGTGPQAAQRVASEMGWEPAKAHKTLAAWDEYRRWVREGAAHARATVPVHRPAGDTGLPDVLAATLMTAACGGETIVPGRPSPIALPDALACWYVFSRDLGACVAVADEATYAPGADPGEYMHLVPVAMVLDIGWTVRDGLIVSLLPHNGFGVSYDEEAILAGGGRPVESWGKADTANSPDGPTGEL